MNAALTTKPDAQVSNYAPQLVDAAIMREARDLSVTLGKTNLVPKQYVGKPDDIFVAILMGHDLGLSPFAALQGIAVINGTPTVWGDVQLAICRNHPKWGGMKEWLKDIDGDLVAFCEVTRTGDPDPYTAQFSIGDATRANLMSKDTYKGYPQKMIANRARSWALRAAFADALKGMGSAEELVDVTTTATVTSTLPEVKQAKEREVKEEPKADATTAKESTVETKVEEPPADTKPAGIASIAELVGIAAKANEALGNINGPKELHAICRKHGVERISSCPPEKWEAMARDLRDAAGLP